MSYIHRLARELGADVFGFQHNDAEAGKGAAEQFFKIVQETFASGKKWATIFSAYDIISAYHVGAVTSIGEWDAHFPQPNYHIDVDWFHRARIQGYELLESNVPVIHHNGSSSTVKAAPHLQRINGVKFAMNEVCYAKKWGGSPHQEQFATPWNEEPKLFETAVA